MKTLKLGRLLLIPFFLAGAELAAQSACAKALKLQIEFSQASYAVREPIRITARLTNVSRELQHIIEVGSKTTGPSPENEEALAMVDDLMKRYPDFRIEETRQLKATNLRYLHRWNESLEVLEAAIEINPLLRTNYQFMWQKVTTQYRTHEAVRQWKANRLEGKKKPDEGIVVKEQ